MTYLTEIVLGFALAAALALIFVFVLGGWG